MWAVGGEKVQRRQLMVLYPTASYGYTESQLEALHAMNPEAPVSKTRVILDAVYMSLEIKLW